LKWLEISSITLDLLEVILNQIIIDKEELNKYLDVLCNCINETIPIISNSTRFNNLFLNQENFKLLSKLSHVTNFLFEKSQVKFFEYENDQNSVFKIINFNMNNLNNNNFDAFINSNSSNNNAIVFGNQKNIDLIFLKAHIYSFIYKSIGNMQKIKDVNFKSFTNEIMNFLESIIMKSKVFFIVYFKFNNFFNRILLH